MGSIELNISNTLSQKFLNLEYKTWELLAIIIGSKIHLSSIRSLELRDLVGGWG